MKGQRKQNKRLSVASIAAMVIVAGLISFAAFAISRNVSVIEKNVKVAGHGVKIIEDSDGGFGKKEISFKNDGADNSKILLRIAYSETWSRADGTIVSNSVNNNNVVTKNWTTDFTNDFVDGNDGWYYYKKTLNPNAIVQVLNSIELNDESYAKYNYDISFRFEAIQADAAAASTVWNRTVTINEESATWAF
ncbi:MAG: hypothetical protein MJ154_02960 [Candidatus Saccharibacteria bacterium]|nr:hypothetical protein [Candidatus Saccharibacteria bacterium]